MDVFLCFTLISIHYIYVVSTHMFICLALWHYFNLKLSWRKWDSFTDLALVPKISLLISDKSVALTCVSPKKELTLACVHVGFFDEDGDYNTGMCRTCLCEHPAAINLDLIANISLPYEQKEEQSSAELPMEQAGRARTRTGNFSYCQRKHQARCIIVYSISYLLSFCRNSMVFYKWKRLSFFSTGQVQLIHLSKDMHSEFQTNIRSFLKLFPLVKACWVTATR